MLRVNSVSKSYGGDTVLQDVSFTVSPGERAGLVGPNGSGKSTLLQILAGHVLPDSGTVWSDPADRVAYLPQYPRDALDLTVRQALMTGAGNPARLKRRIEFLEGELQTADGEQLVSLLEEYADAQEEFQRLGGYRLDARIEEVVGGLGLNVPDLDVAVASLSGGNKTKLSLARLVISDATILLLDEPTNYLDLQALLWLERFVLDGDRTYVIVSHDRRFLDRTVHTILELDPAEHSIRQWAGSYSDFAAGKAREEQKLQETYRDQQLEIARIEEDVRRTRDQARSTENRTQNDYLRGRAKKVAAKAKARERRLQRVLDSPDLLEKPKRGWGLHLVDLRQEQVPDNRLVVEVSNLTAGYGDIAVLRGVSLIVRGSDRVALLGANGSGKSTLLRCLAGQQPFEGTVRWGPSMRIGVLSQEMEELPLDQTVFGMFRRRTEVFEDEARTYLHRFLFTGEEVFKPIGALSLGQRAKLALAVLVLSNANVLLLDEPTSHMDMPALEAIEEALAGFQGPLIVVSHDRYFLDRIGINRVLVLEEGRLNEVDGLEEYEREIVNQ